MKTELRAHTRWARWDGGNRWTLGLTSPISPQLLSWLTTTYRVEKVKPLASGTVALLLHAGAKTNATLMELPKPKWGGSNHECNRVSWNS